MLRITRPGAATVLTVASVVGLAVMGYCYEEPPRDVVLRPPTVATMDSLAATAPAFTAQLDTSAAIARARADTLEQLRKRMAAQRRSADSAGRVADSLAAVARSADDWKRAYEFRFLENVQLRGELEDAGSRIRLLVADTLRLSADKDSAIARIRVHERVEAMIRRDVAAANERMACYVVRWPKKVRCPTRTEAAIGGALTGAILATVTLTR